VFDHLQIYDRRERAAVGLVDVAISAVALLRRPRRAPSPVSRILVLRLERIGDLLMSLAALDAIRHRAPSAHVHLVVGSWNRSIVPLLSAVDSHELMDAPWLSRTGTGQPMATLLARARSWRRQRFDLAINFEPDIRSNLLVHSSGAPRCVGFGSGGGAGLLTTALEYDPRAHTSRNLLRLVDTALPPGPDEANRTSPPPRLVVRKEDQEAAVRLLPAGSKAIVGLHVSGGRAIKQWPIERFAEVATQLARRLPARLVLTGSEADQLLITRMRALLPGDIEVTDVSGTVDLSAFAALLEQLRLFVTGDTGPMHLAAAVGTPTVAIFGPSDPRRHGPLTDRARVVTTALWCRPCNRVRRPPERCSRGTPDCLTGISVEEVIAAAEELLTSTQTQP
jgi:lipopolysaccharide heptosyltransferase II